MGRFFNLDSPFISFMNRVADLMILNLIYLLFCIPVITIGPATVALYYVTLKMARNEESYIFKSFFKSFKLNFVQGLIMWIIDLAIFGVMYLDFKVLSGGVAGIEASGTMFTALKVVLMAISLIMVFTFTFTFPVLAKFDNSIKNTYKNSLIMSIRHFLTSIVIILCWGAVFLAGYFFPQIIILHILILFSLAAFAPSFLLVKNFDNYIPAEEREEEDGADLQDESNIDA